MGEALLGVVASSWLGLGGLIGMYARMPPQWVGVIMAFGAGRSLISMNTRTLLK